MRHLILPFVATALFLTACESKSEPAKTAPKTAAAEPAPLPANLFLTSAPADAKDVKDAKEAGSTLKVGDKVVLTGRIGGGKDPFADGRAVFTLIDNRLPSCSDGEDKDHCKTPWDYCCEARKDIMANAATIQVVNAEGRPLKTKIKGEHGIKELSKVTVVGTVSEFEDGNLLVKADGIYVEQ